MLRPYLKNRTKWKTRRSFNLFRLISVPNETIEPVICNEQRNGGGGIAHTDNTNQIQFFFTPIFDAINTVCFGVLARFKSRHKYILMKLNLKRKKTKERKTKSLTSYLIGLIVPICSVCNVTFGYCPMYTNANEACMNNILTYVLHIWNLFLFFLFLWFLLFSCFLFQNFSFLSFHCR